MSNCCPHVTKSTGHINDEEWNRIVSNPFCDTCQEQGINFWLCLHPGCHAIGCSDADGGQDHSTEHYSEHPTHSIQVNISTIRAWCYKCNKETNTPFLVRLRNSLKTGKPLEHHSHHHNNEKEEFVAKASDPIDSNPYNEQRMSPEDIGGLVGLVNLGNTCYMNSALQCLSNVPALTEFFLTCSSLVTKADFFNCIQRDKPSLSQAYFGLLRELWSARVNSSYVPPSKLLFAFKAAHPMFRGYHQQDSQEFLRCFMDQLHEELMEPLNELESQNVDNTDELEANLESVSETDSVSQDEEEEQEYETADSGVSEESVSTDQTSVNLSSSRNNSGCNTSRKRKHQNSLSKSGDVPRSDQESEQLSPSSDGECEFLDAASSRSASPPNSYTRTTFQRSPTKVPVDVVIKRKPKTYRSVITDVFDGKLISSVQCLTCDRVSTTTETFQDLSLPIPSQETMNNLRQTKTSPSSASSTTSLSSGESDANSGWLSWLWSSLSEWIYGPNISLQDCLAYFFSADELKGDNMYSCEKCKKLRNGLKYSRVTVLPETLCIHLKRFRHEFAFSSKISSKVTFPLVDLDMGPWLHRQDCISKESKYDLIGVICHHGTAGGGHYTAYALNNIDQEWYEYDDSYVTKVEAATVMNAEAYVLFYRKNGNMEPLREELQTFLEQQAGLVKFYISRQWLNKFENFAEPGPVDNSDFLCPHGGVLPTKFAFVNELCVAVPQNAWNFLHSTFGGGPACSRLYECSYCKEELDALNRQKDYELETFKQLHAQFQESPDTNIMYCLSSSWFKQWEQFVLGRQRDPPSQIDNKSIVTTRFSDRQPILRPSADYISVSQDIWSMFRSIYGGGPEVILRSNGTSLVIVPKAISTTNNNSNLKHRARSSSESTVNTSVSSSPPKQ